MIKNILFLIFPLFSSFIFSQENTLIGKYISLGHLEASKIQMFESDGSYIDTTLFSYKTNTLFLDIVSEKKALLFNMFSPNRKKEDSFKTLEIKQKSDTLFAFENNEKIGYFLFVNNVLEMCLNFDNSAQNSTFYFVKDTFKVQSTLKIKSQKSVITENKWKLDINSINTLGLSFTQNNEIVFTTSSESIYSEYNWVEFPIDLFILFENNKISNYMKIVSISKDKLSVLMPVNKKLEKFDFVKTE